MDFPIDNQSKPRLDLSPKERDVVFGCAEGLTDQQIADRMGVSVTSVHSYWRRLRKKLGTRNRCHSLGIVLKAEFEAEWEAREAS